MNKDFQSFLDQLENKRLYLETKANPQYHVSQPQQHPIFNKTNASTALGIPVYRVLKCFTVDNILWVQYLHENNRLTTKLTIPQLIRAMEKSRRAKAKHILVEKADAYIYIAHNTTNGNSYELYHDDHNHYCSCPDFHNTNTALQLAHPLYAEHHTIYCKHIIALIQQFKPHLITP